jgi:hypothetical protein
VPHSIKHHASSLQITRFRIHHDQRRPNQEVRRKPFGGRFDPYTPTELKVRRAGAGRHGKVVRMVVGQAHHLLKELDRQLRESVREVPAEHGVVE